MPSRAARPRSVASVVTSATPFWAAAGIPPQDAQLYRAQAESGRDNKEDTLCLSHPHLRLDSRQGVLSVR